MEQIDIRQHSDRERELLRKQVIRLRKQGKGNKEVSCVKPQLTTDVPELLVKRFTYTQISDDDRITA